MPLPRRLAGGLAGLLAAGCGTPDAADVAVRDSAGVEIVETRPPAAGAGGWTLDPAPLLDVGADQDDPHQLLLRPTAPVRLGDGRIVVGDNGAMELRFYDPAGRWLASAGRQGGGPGEFTDLQAVFRGPGDSLLVFQRRSGVVSVFDAEGHFARLARPEPAGGAAPMVEGVFPNGDWLARHGLHPDAVSDVSGLARTVAVLHRHAPDGRRLDSLASGPGTEALFRVSPQSVEIWGLPFPREAVAGTAGGRAFLGDTERLELRLLSGGGEGRERLVRLLVEPVRLTRDLLDARVARELASMRGATEAALATHRARLEEAPRPAHLPAFDRVTVAAEGDLWFRLYPARDTDPTRFAVTDSAGRWRAWVTGPPRFAPGWIEGDVALGIWLDDDDVAHVRAYRLRR
jgi:hypothetical protein